jgi:hypothetical protein
VGRGRGLRGGGGSEPGSFIIESVGWPWAFFINLPIGAYSLWRGASLLPESERRRRTVASTASAWRC